MMITLVLSTISLMIPMSLTQKATIHYGVADTQKYFYCKFYHRQHIPLFTFIHYSVKAFRRCNNGNFITFNFINRHCWYQCLYRKNIKVAF